MDAADDETVAETGIKELEAAIDDAVYDLFELSDEEREVVEEYLDMFYCCFNAESHPTERWLNAPVPSHPR